MKPLAVCTVVNFGITDGLWFWHYCLWYNQLTPLVWLSYLKCFQLNIRINWRSLNPVALSGKYTKLELSFLIFSVTLWSLFSESQHRRVMFQGSSHLPPTVPQTAFRSNSKSKFAGLWFEICSTNHSMFCTRYDSVIVVTCAKFGWLRYEQDHYKVLLNFE